MSEYDEIDRERRHEEKPEAKVHTASWGPWVWIIPVIAIFFVGWLIVRYGFFGGGDITVTFTEARGLDRYSPVRFRGAKVGTVQKITVDEDLDKVVVRISMDASMNHALREGTRFWIVEPGIEGGGLGGLLSGTYVAIEPVTTDSKETRDFVGQEFTPILAAPEAGRTFIVEGEGVGGVAIGTPVEFQGMRVGRVLGTEYVATSGKTRIHVFVVQRFANHVRQATRWYRGGGVQVSLGGGGVSLAGASISSLLASPLSFYTPDVLAGAPMSERAVFELHPNRNAAVASSDGPHLDYVTFFPGPLKGLTEGTPVQMKGVAVGWVRDVRLRYVESIATLETPVTLVIDPRALEMQVDDSTSREMLRAMLDSAMQRLVQKGLRATLATSLVLPGASAVSLELIGTPGSARLGIENDPPVIPAAQSGGIEGALAGIGDVATTIRNLPLREIASHLRSASARVDRLVNDPVLDESLARLNRSLTDIEQAAAITRENVGPIAENLRSAAASAQNAARTVESTAATASAQVTPIAESLRNAAESAEAAAQRIEQLVGTSARQNYDLGELIKELTRAAEAVRQLSNYLAENPDALLKGRAKP